MKVFAALCLASAAVAVKLPSYYFKGSEGGSSGELAQKGPGSGPTSSEVYAYLSAKWDACVDAYGEDECADRAAAMAEEAYGDELAQKPSGGYKSSAGGYYVDSGDELAQKPPKSGPSSTEIYDYVTAKWDACVDAYGEDECADRAAAMAAEAMDE